MIKHFLDSKSVINARHKIYNEDGYFVIKGFMTSKDAEETIDFWVSDIGDEFAGFVKNTDVTSGTPKYKYNRPTDRDFAYCTHIWNEPIDERMHEYVVISNMIRNQILSKPLYFAAHEATGQALQYRVNRTVSSDRVVKKHADYFSEYRADPTGSHVFDPSRLEITIFLSDYDKDYTSGGFCFYKNGENAKPIIFGRDNAVGRGDLVIWRYSIFHEVSNVTPISEAGFLRVIVPTFDIYS